MNIAPISNNYYDEVNQVCAAPQVADEKTAAATPLPESKPPVSAKHEPTLWEIMFTGRQRKGAPGCAVNDEGKPTAPPVTAAETAVSTGISTSAPTSTPTSTDTSTATGTPAPITPGPDAGSYTPPNTFDTDTGTGINVTPTEIVPPPPDAGAGVSPPDVMPTIIST
ncbi:MAG TPA: hypothetical protein VMT55_04455, partial [Candidatus Sulfotelmatobacter sp.]|nr:hypothetical protein [Candidatus Sulfotelmatobacter sp.]